MEKGRQTWRWFHSSSGQHNLQDPMKTQVQQGELTFNEHMHLLTNNYFFWYKTTILHTSFMRVIILEPDRSTMSNIY